MNTIRHTIVPLQTRPDAPVLVAGVAELIKDIFFFSRPGKTGKVCMRCDSPVGNAFIDIKIGEETIRTLEVRGVQKDGDTLFFVPGDVPVPAHVELDGEIGLPDEIFFEQLAEMELSKLDDDGCRDAEEAESPDDFDSETD